MIFDVAGYRVRRARPEDEAAIQALFELDTPYFVQTEGAPPRPDEAHDLMYVDLPPGRSLDHKLTFVVEDAAGIAGVIDMVDGFPDAQTHYLGQIYLAPSARGRGLGTQLLEALWAFTQRAGRRALRLAVVVANTGARRLYDRLGFQLVARRARTTWTGAVIEVDVLERVT